MIHGLDEHINRCDSAAKLIGALLGVIKSGDTLARRAACYLLQHLPPWSSAMGDLFSDQPRLVGEVVLALCAMARGVGDAAVAAGALLAVQTLAEQKAPHKLAYLGPEGVQQALGDVVELLQVGHTCEVCEEIG